MQDCGPEGKHGDFNRRRVPEICSGIHEPFTQVVGRIPQQAPPTLDAPGASGACFFGPWSPPRPCRHSNWDPRAKL